MAISDGERSDAGVPPARFGVLPSAHGVETRMTAFLAAATAYCELLERHADLGADALLPQVHAALVTLYAAVLALPERHALMRGDEPADPAHGMRSPSGARTPVPVTPEEHRALARALRVTLGARDGFTDVADAEAADVDTVPASLSHELSEIHRDLRAGLAMLASDGLAYGLWHARTFFESHWNAHLGASLRALEVLARRKGGCWPVGAQA